MINKGFFFILSWWKQMGINGLSHSFFSYFSIDVIDFI